MISTFSSVWTRHESNVPKTLSSKTQSRFSTLILRHQEHFLFRKDEDLGPQRVQTQCTAHCFRRSYNRSILQRAIHRLPYSHLTKKQGGEYLKHTNIRDHLGHKYLTRSITQKIALKLKGGWASWRV